MRFGDLDVTAPTPATGECACGDCEFVGEWINPRIGRVCRGSGTIRIGRHARRTIDESIRIEAIAGCVWKRMTRGSVEFMTACPVQVPIHATAASENVGGIPDENRSVAPRNTHVVVAQDCFARPLGRDVIDTPVKDEIPGAIVQAYC